MFETQNASHPPAKQGMKASDIQGCFHPSIQARMGWPHPSLCRRSGTHGLPSIFRSRGGSMDPDEHLRRDIRTPGFNPRSRLPTPANRCSGCLATWESVTRYRGGTVPESHGVPATPLVSDMGPHPTARPCKEPVQWAHRPRPLQPEFPPPRRGFATIRTTAPTRARYGSNEPRRR